MPPADVDPSLGIVTVEGLRRLSGIAELTFGLRYPWLNGQIDFKAPINQEVEKTRDWVDPVVGVILRTPEGHRWHATLIADICGFGVGSDLSWQLFPSAGFDCRSAPLWSSAGDSSTPITRREIGATVSSTIWGCRALGLGFTF